MGDFNTTDRVQPSGVSEHADFGITEGIHYPAKPTEVVGSRSSVAASEVVDYGTLAPLEIVSTPAAAPLSSGDNAGSGAVKPVDVSKPLSEFALRPVEVSEPHAEGSAPPSVNLTLPSESSREPGVGSTPADGSVLPALVSARPADGRVLPGVLATRSADAVAALPGVAATQPETPTKTADAGSKPRTSSFPIASSALSSSDRNADIAPSSPSEDMKSAAKLTDFPTSTPAAPTLAAVESDSKPAPSAVSAPVSSRGDVLPHIIPLKSQEEGGLTVQVPPAPSNKLVSSPSELHKDRASDFPSGILDLGQNLLKHLSGKHFDHVETPELRRSGSLISNDSGTTSAPRKLHGDPTASLNDVIAALPKLVIHGGASDVDKKLPGLSSLSANISDAFGGLVMNREKSATPVKPSVGEQIELPHAKRLGAPASDLDTDAKKTTGNAFESPRGSDVPKGTKQVDNVATFEDVFKMVQDPALAERVKTIGEIANARINEQKLPAATRESGISPFEAGQQLTPTIRSITNNGHNFGETSGKKDISAPLTKLFSFELPAVNPVTNALNSFDVLPNVFKKTNDAQAKPHPSGSIDNPQVVKTAALLASEFLDTVKNMTPKPSSPELQSKNPGTTSDVVSKTATLGSQILIQMAESKTKANEDDKEKPRPVGGVSPSSPESSRIVAAPAQIPQVGSKSSSLDRDSSLSLKEASVKVGSLEALIIPIKSMQAQELSTFGGLKASSESARRTTEVSQGLAGRIAESSGFARRIDANGVAVYSVESKSVAANLLAQPSGKSNSESAKGATVETLPNTSKTLMGDVQVSKTPGVSIDRFEVIKSEGNFVGGLKASSINLVSGRAQISGDKPSAKSELNSTRIEIPTVGIATTAFVNGMTLNTAHGIAGSIKVDTSGVRDSAIAITAGKEFTSKIDAGQAGAKFDAFSGVKEHGISLIHATTMTVKASAIDISSAIRIDATANSGTTGLASINGSGVQPTAHGIKSDANPAGKIEPAGRAIDGKLCPPGDGAVRGTALTPTVANAIASSIRFGYPIPEGLAFVNGSYAITFGDEVLYFPGLKAALKFAEVVGLIDAEPESGEEQETPKPTVASTVRVRYSVKQGESLNSIAQSELGDVRFSDLILTINRSEILYRLAENGKVPFVYPSQLIWLPSEQEVNIYRKNFFGKHGTEGSALSSIDSAEVTVEDESREGDRAVRKALHEEYLANNTVLQPGRPRTTVRDLPYLQIPPNADRPVVTLEDNNQQFIDHTRTVVIRPAITEESPSVNNVDSGSLRVVDNRFISNAPPLGEQAVILHASVDGAESTDTVVVYNEVLVERLLDVRSLTSGVRVVVTDIPRGPERFFVRLQVCVDGNWTVVAAYEGNSSCTSRIRYGVNGTRNSMTMNLPSHAVKAMAVKDFARNWTAYKTNFENNDIKRVQVDSVPPTPIGFKSLAAGK